MSWVIHTESDLRVTPTLDLLDNAILVYRHAMEISCPKNKSRFNSMSGLRTCQWSPVTFYQNGLNDRPGRSDFNES